MERNIKKVYAMMFMRMIGPEDEVQVQQFNGASNSPAEKHRAPTWVKVRRNEESTT